MLQTTDYEFTDRRGNTYSMPADLYFVKMQQEYAKDVLDKTCEGFKNENLQHLDDDAQALVGVADAFAKVRCAEAMENIADSNKPSDYFQYKLAKAQAFWGNIFRAGDFLLRGACMFQLGGACGGFGMSGGGNSYGDNWVFNQGIGGPAGGTGGHGVMGEEGMAPGGEGLGGEMRDATNSIIFGHGNSVTSPYPIDRTDNSQRTYQFGGSN
jgi:hypothetical protein